MLKSRPNLCFLSDAVRSNLAPPLLKFTTMALLRLLRLLRVLRTIAHVLSQKPAENGEPGMNK